MSSSGFDKQALDAAFESTGISPTTRAEKLDTADFIRLADALPAGGEA
jgi:16S rRNA (adenine1518-N6/adenine1519-N6)-dimethyltransferase